MSIHSFEYYRDRINKEFFSEELKDIIEITYAYSSYGDKHFNRTLFSILLWRDHEQFDVEQQLKILPKLYEETLSVLTDKKNFALDTLAQLKTWKQTDRKRLLVTTLEYVLLVLKLTLTWLPFEAKKAGYDLWISSQESDQRVVALETLEQELFWNLIKSDTTKTILAYRGLLRLYQQGEKKFSLQQKETMTKVFMTLQSEYPFLKKIQEPDIVTKNTFQDLSTTKIRRDSYVKLLQKCFDFYELDIPIIVDQRSSIYDGSDALYIPDSKAYEALSLQRVLQLIIHEIEVHYLTDKNNTLIRGLRWWRNLLKEEWLAMTVERIFSGWSMDEIWAGNKLPEILVGEIIDPSLFKDFIECSEISKWSNNTLGTYLRLKRNYSLEYPGTQHKDTSYNAWEREVARYINSGKDLSTLWIGKVNFEELAILQKIVDREDIQLTYPVFLAERIKNTLLGISLSEEEFAQDIYERYHFDYQALHSRSNIRKSSTDINEVVEEIVSLLEEL